MTVDRRQWMEAVGGLGACAALAAWPGVVSAQTVAERAWFDLRSSAEVYKALGGRPAVSAQVVLNAPDVSENSAAVEVGVQSLLPQTTHIYLVVEKNPMPLAAVFEVLPGTEPSIQTFLKLGQSSPVVAIVRADGRLYMASKETRVTLGACGA